MGADHDDILAKLVVERGHLTQDQVSDALQIQKAAREQLGLEQDLATVLVSKKLLSSEQAEELKQAVAVETGDARRIGGYEVVAKIGQGGMGAVYEALKEDTRERVALKILPSSVATMDMIARFKRESSIVASLNHDNIVRCVEFGQDKQKGMWFCALELIDGEDLDKYMKRKRMLSEDEAVNIAQQIAMALQHAHFNGLVHRDVKPGNIMVTEGGTAKLLDLGLARQAGMSAEVTKLTQSGQFVGSPYYASPEQATAEKDIDTRSDIYSLGATMYHMVTGSPPFSGTSTAHLLYQHVNERLKWPGDVNRELSDDICQVIAKMMAKDPRDRYQEPNELIAHLDLLKEGSQVDVGEDVLRRSVLEDSKVPRLERKRLKVRGPLRQSGRGGARGTGAGHRKVGSTARHSPVRDRRQTPQWMPYAIGGGGAAVALAALLLVLGRSSTDGRPAVASVPPRVRTPSASPATVGPATRPVRRDDRADSVRGRQELDAIRAMITPDLSKYREIRRKLVQFPAIFPGTPEAEESKTLLLEIDVGYARAAEIELATAIESAQALVSEDRFDVAMSILRSIPVRFGEGPWLAASGEAKIAAAVARIESQRAAPELARGLVGHWTFDGDRRGTAADSSRHRHDGRLHGDPSTVDGVLGKALRFDGKNDFIEVPGLRLATSSSYSVAAWAKLSRGGDAHQAIVQKAWAGLGYEFQGFGGWHAAHDKAERVWRAWLKADSPTSWHHVAMVVSQDQGTAMVFVDDVGGEPYQYGPKGSSGFDYGDVWRIAAGGGKGSGRMSPFEGAIDDVRVYDRALSREEVKTLYAMRSISEREPRAAAPVRHISMGSDDGAWSYYNGAEFKATEGRVEEGSDTKPARLSFMSEQGAGYVSACKTLDPPVQIPTFSVKLRGRGCQIGFRIVDSTSQCHQYKSQKALTEEWQAFSLGLDRSPESWGGANDRIVHQPVKVVIFNASMRAHGAGFLEIRDLVVPSPSVSGVRALLTEFDALVLKPDFARAVRLAQAEAAKPGKAAHTGMLRAAARVAVILRDRPAAIVKGAKLLVGTEITLQMTTGEIVGKLKEATEDKLVIATSYVINRQKKERLVDVQWSSLIPEQNDEFAVRGGLAADLSDFAIVRAYLALAADRLDDASDAARAAGEHPLAGHVMGRIRDAKAQAAYSRGMNEARRLVRSKRWDEAVAAAAEALEAKPDDADAKALLADVRRRTEPEPTIALELAPGVTMEFQYIRPGTFVMGGDRDTEFDWQGIEKPKHKVVITKGFYLGKHEVTQAQYEAMLGMNPSRHKMPSRPVEQVLWADAVEFCRCASEKTRREVRLPTEAEWEYACRAGSSGRWTCGDTNGLLGDYAWYNANSGMQAHPVGQKKPNAWGIFDMHGNVLEWVADPYSASYYASSPKEDPMGPAVGRDRVLRGGAYHFNDAGCRSASRMRMDPTAKTWFWGFRVAVSLSSRRP